MKVKIIFTGMTLVLTILSTPGLTAEDTAREMSFSSLIGLASSVPSGQRQVLVDRYLAGLGSTRFPVVEDSLVHFIFRSSDVVSVSVPGDFNGWNKDRDPMLRLEGTDMFYLTRTFETDARLDYKFVVDGDRWILDPLNPMTVSGGFGPNSEVSLPDYHQPEEIIKRDDIPHGTIEVFQLTSRNTGNCRQVQVYLPPSYHHDETVSFPSLYVNDGGEYLTLGSMDRVLDLLVSTAEIPGLIVVFVDPVDRNSEYMFDMAFEKMVVEELVPMIDERYRTIDDPESRGMMGASLGGLVSIHISWQNPDLFGLCGSQSGAFHPQNESIVGRVSGGSKRNIRYYLDWGTYEKAIQSSNKKMLAALRGEGYEVTSFEYHEGHSWGSWRAHLDDLLTALYGTRD